MKIQQMTQERQSWGQEEEVQLGWGGETQEEKGKTGNGVKNTSKT